MAPRNYVSWIKGLHVRSRRDSCEERKLCSIRWHYLMLTQKTAPTPIILVTFITAESSTSPLGCRPNLNQRISKRYLGLNKMTVAPIKAQSRGLLLLVTETLLLITDTVRPGTRTKRQVKPYNIHDDNALTRNYLRSKMKNFSGIVFSHSLEMSAGSSGWFASDVVWFEMNVS